MSSAMARNAPTCFSKAALPSPVSDSQLRGRRADAPLLDVYVVSSEAPELLGAVWVPAAR
jgi:hypothetical protein